MFSLSFRFCYCLFPDCECKVITFFCFLQIFWQLFSNFFQRIFLNRWLIVNRNCNFFEIFLGEFCVEWQKYYDFWGKNFLKFWICHAFLSVMGGFVPVFSWKNSEKFEIGVNCDMSKVVFVWKNRGVLPKKVEFFHEFFLGNSFLIVESGIKSRFHIEPNCLWLSTRYGRECHLSIQKFFESKADCRGCQLKICIKRKMVWF